MGGNAYINLKQRHVFRQAVCFCRISYGWQLIIDLERTTDEMYKNLGDIVLKHSVYIRKEVFSNKELKQPSAIIYIYLHDHLFSLTLHKR